MRKGIRKIIIIVVIFIIIIGGYFVYKKYKEYMEEQRIKNAIVKVELINPLEIEFKKNIKLSDLIKSINGKLINDFIINTDVIGEQEVSFEYINEEDIKVPYHFKLKIIDITPPVIWLNDTYSVTVGYSKNLLDAIMCGDDTDNNPAKEIIGEYSVNKVGTYKLQFVAIDKSGNKTIKDFKLKVKPKSNNSNNSNSSSIPFGSLYNEYKRNDTKIGIDVSKWQGDIDFEKVKETGVEFVYIKIGGQNGIGKNYYFDPKFERNYEGFSKVGIPIGLYFYSYADSIKEARKQALWIVDNIKDKKIDLPIAFDWENWSSFNNFKMSFATLTNASKMFIRTLEENGYKGMNYGSKNYLEKIWLETDSDIWLAHYTNNTNYKGKYKCWQRTSSAKLSGITDNTVDFNICYY